VEPAAHHQSIGYTAITTGELWNKHPEKVARHARRLGRQESERRQGAADGVDGSAAVVRQAGEPARVAAICASANGSTAPVEDIIDASRASSTTASGKVVENAPHIMKYWSDFASYPFQSHDLWFITEDIRWGKFEPSSTPRR
jgi:nitrate/nitrite transport system substrate-binding protein